MSRARFRQYDPVAVNPGTFREGDQLEELVVEGQALQADAVAALDLPLAGQFLHAGHHLVDSALEVGVGNVGQAIREVLASAEGLERLVVPK